MGGLIILFDHPFENHPGTVMLLANVLKYLYSSWSTKWFCEQSSEKYLAPIRMLYPFHKCAVDPFVDISLISVDRSFISFL